MIAKVISFTMMTSDVVELMLSIKETPVYHPGQRALLTLKAGETEIKRAYSIVNYKKVADETQLTFAIKILPDGKGTQSIKTLRVGDSIPLNGIFGAFVLQETDAPKVFVGTGTGIAPIIAMAEATKTPKILYFSVSYEVDLFYKDRIRSIQNLTSHIHVSREVVADCEPGRIELTSEEFLPESEFYLCGNPNTVKLFKATLTERGFTKIYTEMY